jgi:hypothetical protein
VSSVIGSKIEGKPTPRRILTVLLIVSLNFDRNSFAGSIPSGVGGMRDLEYASLQENILTGSIPIEIASLERLRK